LQAPKEYRQTIASPASGDDGDPSRSTDRVVETFNLAGRPARASAAEYEALLGSIAMRDIASKSRGSAVCAR
jgi:hypothetical protein